MKDLEFKLMPQGVIVGKVLDEDGEPAGEGVSRERHAESAGIADL